MLVKQREKNDACSAAAHVKDELFAKLERGAVGVGFDFSEMPVLSEMADGTYELNFGTAEELYEGVGVLFLASAFAAVLFTEKLKGGGIPCVES